MSLESDLLLDRRRLKRRLFLWRTLAVLALIVAAMVSVGTNPDLVSGREHIARVTVAGLITEDRRMNEAIAAVARDESARALILVIDSPGGTVAGGESLHGVISRCGRQEAGGRGDGRHGGLGRLHDRHAG